MMKLVVKEYLKPKSLEEAYSLFIEDKKNHIIAGGAWIKLSLKTANKLIDLDELHLNEIKEVDHVIEIGSMVTLREIETNPIIKNLCTGILSKAIHQIMGVTIRNIATIGGSVMGKYAFSDIIPVLQVLDTRLVFYKHGEMSLQEFLENPKMERDILLNIRIKKNLGIGYFKKVAVTPLDFSILNIAVSKNSEGFKICVGATPYLGQLAVRAMEYINGFKNVSEEKLLTCADLVVEEIKFSKNNKASKEYREELAKVYVKRGLKKVIAHES